ncbi:hypothetical protein Scel_26610 [Streptomyces cellostaticus]|nr:hypothetical protein Scel_26610 [Streptomyces cellostaticus]
MLRAAHTAGKAAAHAHNRDRLVAGRFHFLQTLASLMQVSGHPLEEVAELLFAHLRHLVEEVAAFAASVNSKFFSDKIEDFVVG